jgi:hypothetical protein
MKRTYVKPGTTITVPLEEGGTTEITASIGFESVEHLTQIANQGGMDIFDDGPSDRVFERNVTMPAETFQYLKDKFSK